MRTRWGKLFTLIRTRGGVFAAGVVFAILAFVALNYAMEPLSRSEYCGSGCHEMNISYQTWELSSHGTNPNGIRVDCIECHLPPRHHYIRHVVAKGYAGTKDVIMHLFGPEYDREKMRRRVLDHMDNDTCLHCHDGLDRALGSSPAREAHQATLAEPHKPENRCVTCHENVGHERHETLFSMEERTGP